MDNLSFFDKIILKKNKVIGEIEKKERPSVIDQFLYLFLKKFLGQVAKITKKRIGNPLIIHNKYVYFALPKIASTSLKKAFKDCGGKGISKKDKQRILENKNFFKFSFVRNPYDRLVSCWKNKVQNPQVRETIGHGMYKGFYKYEKIYGGMPFKEFIKVISKIPDEKSDPHFRSQYKFLTNNEGKLLTEFIGKFENLEKGYEKICEIMGIKNPPKLKHERKSKRKNYREYYDEETKKLVAERYKKDLELFDYRF